MSKQGSGHQLVFTIFKSCQSVFSPLHFFLAVFAGREERVEWLQGLGAMWKKAMVKVNHTEEFAELSLSCRFRKLLNNPYFLLQWANACAIDPVSQELEPSSTPDTLLGIDRTAVEPVAGDVCVHLGCYWR